MSSPYESATLIIRLYELRRDPTMREARNWYARSFNPSSIDDMLQAVTGPNSAYFRMVTTYWDMACSFVNNGAIDAQMFNDANGEHLFVYAKLEPFLPALREAMGNPNFLGHLEKTVKEVPDYEQRLAAIRDRMTKLIEIWKQKNAAQAAAASGD